MWLEEDPILAIETLARFFTMAFGSLRNFTSHRDAEKKLVEKGVSTTVYEGREVEVGLGTDPVYHYVFQLHTSLV